jgi:tol-pal system protein YbgF
MQISPSVLLKLVCAGVLGIAAPAMAQAPVNDISTPSSRRPYIEEGYDSGGSRTYGTSGSGSYSGSTTGGGSEAGNLFRQLQQLQEEVASLRGQLEEQAYEIQKLKQQHQDDFAVLDRRIGGGAAPAPAAAVGGALPPATVGMPASRPVAATGNSDGKEEYEAAYAKLKGKDYPGATAAFRAFVDKYPTSDYAGNSWFWLGFVYQTQGDIDGAGKAFSTLIERFPGHNKAEDAKYNLGKIYHQQGRTDEARRLLQEVAGGNSKSAPLAKSYLETM